MCGQSGGKPPHSKRDRGIQRVWNFLGKAENRGVLEVLQRPASEGEPYKEKIVEATACDRRGPYKKEWG